MAIYIFLKKHEDPSDDKIDEFKQTVCKWLELFLSLFQTKHVTHILVCLVPEFLSMYGSLDPFSQQGLENLNDDLTKSFFSGTKHHDLHALQQMLLKQT